MFKPNRVCRSAHAIRNAHWVSKSSRFGKVPQTLTIGCENCTSQFCVCQDPISNEDFIQCQESGKFSKFKSEFRVQSLNFKLLVIAKKRNTMRLCTMFVLSTVTITIFLVSGNVLVSRGKQ